MELSLAAAAGGELVMPESLSHRQGLGFSLATVLLRLTMFSLHLDCVS